MSQILSGCADSVLQNLMIVAVTPAPHTGRLQITVAATLAADVNEPSIILQHLNRAMTYLRQELATNIHRKKVPELVFGF
jgi:ribosome-binding factor A